MINKQFSNFWGIKYRIMKLAAIFLILGINFSWANNTYSQSTVLSLKVNNKTVQDVFSEIEQKSEYVFFYYDGVLDVNRRVKVDVTNQTIDVILKQLFTGTDNTYVIKDRQIFISKNSRVGPMPVIAQKKGTLRGKVLDDLGEPLPGAAILVSGSTRGVTTDLDGSFSIDVNKGEKLVVSFLGMEDQQVMVDNQQDVVVRMKPKADELDEVTIVAFGKQKKESVIGAITTVSAESLKVPVAKISTSLAGQMAGIVAVQRSGEPGAGADFWIRGINTFGDNNRPLVLVDGIERSMDLVDPEDIESFSILKDATATAVYGVRGANGIVLITTKKGKEGKPRINARVEYGVSNPVRTPKLANASQWIDYYNDITYDYSGRIPYPADIKQKYLDGSDPDLYPNVDWMKEIFKNTSTSQRVNLNISGGGKRIRYYVSGSFYNENGLYNAQKGDQYNPSLYYNKFSFRSNLDIDVTSSTIVNVNLANQYENKNRPGVETNAMWEWVMQTVPISTPTVYSDGTIASPHNGANPYNSLNNTGYSHDFYNNAQALIGLTQDFSMFLPGLKANVKFSWDATNAATINRTKGPASYYATGRDEDGNLIFHKNGDGSNYLQLTKNNWGDRTTNLEASLTYENVFNEVHRVGGLFLFNMREYTNNFPDNYIAGFPNKNQGIAARATYSFMDKYFIEGNFGYNGSENFAPGKKFGFFPSIALGYLISNEEFFKRLHPVVNLLKIKGSHGEIGNDRIGGDRRFAFNSEMSEGGGYSFGSMGQTWVGGIATGHPGNPDVSWETAKKTNVGFELGLFDKLKIQTDYFYEKREGIFIQQQSLPSIVGNNVTQYVNLGSMKNQGIDASLEYNQQINEFTIQARANFTFNRNKKLYDDKPTPVWAYQEDAGLPYLQQKGLIALGLFESEEDIATSPKQNFGTVRPGDIKYKDINGDGVIDAYDKVAIGRTDVPEINYGFGASIGWRGFDLSLFFQGVGNVTNFISGSPIYGQSGNILVLGQIYSDVADNRWSLSNPDPSAKYPRLSMALNENNRQNSTYNQRDMSFLRLKNAEFGYTVPRKITSRIGLSTVRFYIQGLNLLTFSKFKLWDPEISEGFDNANYGKKYPQMRVVNFGLNVNI